MDWSDKRPIEEMNFGELERDKVKRVGVRDRVIGILQSCGVKVADHIAELGCTGVMKVLHADNVGDPEEVGRFLRLGLAGGGVGLPCFVPPTRYCLIHETIGGLESGQEARHPEMVESISRELTPVEAMRTRVIEKARNSGKNKAGDQIAHAVEVFADPASVLEEPLTDGEIARVVSTGEPASNWKCPEHTVLKWNCRYCAAQAIVEGSLEPHYTIESSASDLEIEHVEAAAVPEYLASCEKENATAVVVFVRVATFTRKLARD